VAAHQSAIKEAVARLQNRGIHVSLFIDPAPRQIEAARAAGARGIEIHTGAYCNASGAARERERQAVADSASLAHRLGLEVHGGHGLDYQNVVPIAAIPEIVELNIGHSIIARAVIVGIKQAVREMKELLAKVKP
ncbi:MAG: pyridoxine 5'-phosphate synthase, partial [Chloroflexota bacterium]